MKLEKHPLKGSEVLVPIPLDDGFKVRILYPIERVETFRLQSFQDPLCPQNLQWTDISLVSCGILKI